MKFSRLKKFLVEDSSKTMFLLEGEDAYFREKAVNMIVGSSVTAYPELNISKISQPTVQQIVENISVLPFLSEKRAVILKEYYPQLSEAETIGKKVSENSTSVLIISNANNSLPLKKIEDVCCYIDCGREDAGILKIWIKTLFKGQNKDIEDSAAEMLALYCANDMMKIDNEIKKLSLKQESVITVNDIEQNVSKDADYQAYMLANAVSLKSKNVYEILKDFLSKGDTSSSLYLIMSLYNNYKRMFYAKDSRLSKEKLSQLLGIKPYAVKMAEKAAKKYKKEELLKALNLLAECEYSIKKGNCNAETALFYAVANLIN